jgi:uncharacterized cupin superfamily protein
VDETVQVLEGKFHYRVGDERFELRAGDRCFSPRGLTPAFANAGDDPVRVPVVFSPAKIGPAYFRELSDLFAAGGPPDASKVHAIMNKYGLVLAA